MTATSESFTFSLDHDIRIFQQFECVLDRNPEVGTTVFRTDRGIDCDRVTVDIEYRAATAAVGGFRVVNHG